MRLPTLLAFLLVSCLPLAAQGTFLIGRLEHDGTDFRIACTRVVLRGMTPELQARLGEVVEIDGNTLAPWPAPVVEVVAVRRSTSEFQLGGDARIGRALRFRVSSPTADTYYFLLHVEDAFTPLDAILPGFLHGTFWLELQNVLVVSSGAFRGQWEVEKAIPNEPAFVGLTVFAQAAVGSPGAALLYLNSECATLRAP
ncbi:MAG: hypothetical protein HZB39_14435 [Planctomycetes bacterium]|nr:hypothetical protein [Planctomycetota bacterium]